MIPTHLSTAPGKAHWQAANQRTTANRRQRSPLTVERLEDRSAPASTSPGQTALAQINHFVVIYQENWSFDALYGSFPGANGIANATAGSLSQLDRLTGNPYSSQLGNPFDLSVNGPALTTPPQPIVNGQIDIRFPPGLDTLHPYNMGPYLSPGAKTGDIVHRFWNEQSQINHGAQNQYLTWSDNPGLDMSFFDATNLPEGLLAQQYTMADNFFHAAFGGSFLNHQFLVAAAAPVYVNATTLNPKALPTLDSSGQLALDPTTGKIIHDGSITPIGSPSFADSGLTFDKNYVVNTTFSKNLSPDFIGNTTSASLLPSQNDSNPNDPSRPYIPTIGDRLDAANVSWKWYSGGWNNALLGSPSNPANNGHTPAGDPADPNFQWHHQPLAYYDNFAPWLSNGQRNPLSAAHLQDELNFFADLSSGNLPAVSFVKPIGADNEHPGYASLLEGQQHVADIVHAIQNSADWAHTAIIITYDENGGRWDHVSPPDANDIWGDGTRVPAIIISPYSKPGFVDHTQYDTLSILKTIETRFNLQPLSQYDASAASLANSLQPTPHVSIGGAYLQPDADHLGQFTLIVQGTEGGDNIHLSEDGTATRVHITGPLVNYDRFFQGPISRVEVYGQGGNDRIIVDPDVTLPAFLFGGDGFNHIHAGGGPTVAVGGSGANDLVGGAAAGILIGGAGASMLQAGSGGAIEVAGTTAYDANIAGLKSLLNEWSRTDESYQQRIAHLDGGAAGGLNGSYHLDNLTVQHSAFGDLLVGGPALDWFFARLPLDLLLSLQPGETVTSL